MRITGMYATEETYKHIADKINNSIDVGRFSGNGEVDIDKGTFLYYDFDGEGRMTNYYAGDLMNPCQYDMEAEITVNILYVTEDGEKAVDVSVLEKFFDKNIKIFS